MLQQNQDTKLPTLEILAITQPNSSYAHLAYSCIYVHARLKWTTINSSHSHNMYPCCKRGGARAPPIHLSPLLWMAYRYIYMQGRYAYTNKRNPPHPALFLPLLLRSPSLPSPPQSPLSLTPHKRLQSDWKRAKGCSMC